MGIGKNTTSKSMETGSPTEGKYEDEAKHPGFFTLPVSRTLFRNVKASPPYRCFSVLGVGPGTARLPGSSYLNAVTSDTVLFGKGLPNTGSPRGPPEA